MVKLQQQQQQQRPPVSVNDQQPDYSVMKGADGRFLRLHGGSQ